MATAAAAPAVRIKRVFQAPRERVFTAWTKPEEFEKWMCKAYDETTRIIHCDIREGGSHEIEVYRTDGTIWINRAEYKTVRPPERLVFTFAWEHLDGARKKTGEMKDTLVTVDFFDRGGATEVALTHEFFSTEEDCSRHKNGWEATLDKLEKSLAA